MKILFFIIGIDQLSKWYARRYIKKGDSVHICGKLYLRNVCNTGAAFGIFSKKRGLLIFFTILSFLNLFREEKDMAFYLVLGGGISNFYDRLKGGVTDFIHIDYKYLPVFNLADLGIFLGYIKIFSKKFKKTLHKRKSM